MMDLILAIDNSGSMRSAYLEVEQFAIELINAFELSPTATRVGVVEFRSSASTLISLSHDRGAINAAISNTPYPSGGTNALAGINEAASMFASAGRNNTRRTLVFITDAMVSNPSGTVAAADSLHAQGVLIFALGFGSVRFSTLQQLASSPSSRYLPRFLH